MDAAAASLRVASEIGPGFSPDITAGKNPGFSPGTWLPRRTNTFPWRSLADGHQRNRGRGAEVGRVCRGLPPAPLRPPLLTLYDWPLRHCSRISPWPSASRSIATPSAPRSARPSKSASLEEDDALTIEFANGIVFGLSLREEDVDSPESGSYSPNRRSNPTHRSFS